MKWKKKEYPSMIKASIEPSTFGFEGLHSNQLSYSFVLNKNLINLKVTLELYIEKLFREG